MAGQLRASDIALPTSADSAGALLAAIEKEIALQRSRIAVANADAERFQQGATSQRPVGSRPGPAQRDWQRAVDKLRLLMTQMDMLTARKDLLQLQLDRLDPSNPDTKARQSAADQVASRRAAAEDELYAALTRLREILSR